MTLFYDSTRGPFPAYIHCFKPRSSDSCKCGDVGNPENYAFHCPITRRLQFSVQALRNSALRKKHLLGEKRCCEKTWRSSSMHRRRRGLFLSATIFCTTPESSTTSTSGSSTSKINIFITTTFELDSTEDSRGRKGAWSFELQYISRNCLCC